MRVRCTKILVPPMEHGGVELAEHDAITIGKEYVVLSICVHPDWGAEFLIPDDLLGPKGSMWPAAMFETVDDRLPSKWVAQIDEDGFLNFAPRSWLRPGFWGPEYTESGVQTHEERVQAVADYRRERDIILRESA